MTPAPVINELIPRANQDEVRLSAAADQVGSAVKLTYNAVAPLPLEPVKDFQVNTIIDVQFHEDPAAAAPVPAPAPVAEAVAAIQASAHTPAPVHASAHCPAPVQASAHCPAPVQASIAQVQASVHAQAAPIAISQSQALGQIQIQQTPNKVAQSFVSPAAPIFGPALSVGTDLAGGPVLNLTIGGITIPISLQPAAVPAPIASPSVVGAQSFVQPPPPPLPEPTPVPQVAQSIAQRIYDAQLQAQQFAEQAAIARLQAEQLAQQELKLQQDAGARIAAAQQEAEAAQYLEAQQRADREAAERAAAEAAAQAAQAAEEKRQQEALLNRTAPYIAYNPSSPAGQFATAPFAEVTLPTVVRVNAGTKVGEAAHFYFGASGQVQRQ